MAITGLFQVFDCVSILFSDVVSFTTICSRITPLQVVSMLNQMYSLFDRLTERNGVYKVRGLFARKRSLVWLYKSIHFKIACLGRDNRRCLHGRIR